MAAASNGSEYLEVDLGNVDLSTSSFGLASNADTVAKDEEDLIWAAIERFPTLKRSNFALLRKNDDDDVNNGGESKNTNRKNNNTDFDEKTTKILTIDVTKLDRNHRELVVKKALNTSEQDNFKLVSGVKDRFRRVGLELPNVEVRFENLNITAEVLTGKRALPTLINYTRDKIEGIFKLMRFFRPKRYTLTILDNISGYIKSGRMTLLLGPPGSGKTTLLLALAGKLDNNLEKSGKITYNGHDLSEFCVQRTSAYISQTDNHIPELTVRETFDFAARCQGASEAFSGYIEEFIRLEKQKNIRPSPEIDAYMKALSVAGKEHSISTDYLLKVLGLDICADTVVGNDMNRGVSGGQRKRVTSGEMIVGPKKTLFMDEISTGLDSSTTFQIVKCMRNFVHQMEGTVLMALLQPAPETFELFDDLMLLSEGHMVYHGPREEVLDFFESIGFKLPPRKGVADFLQEVTSRKDQAQYWSDPSKPYRFISPEQIAEAFRNSTFGRAIKDTLSLKYDKSKSHPSALSKTLFAVPKWELFKACFSREVLLMRRHSFLYIFKTCQVAFVGFVTATTFIRTRLHPTDLTYANLYLSCLYFGVIHLMFNGLSELSLMIFRLPVFYKQRDNCFYPAWAWSLSSLVLRVPYSVLESVVWTCIVYYSVGLAPTAGRFFRFMLLLFVIHQMALSLFRMMGSLARDMVIASTSSAGALLAVVCLGGFVIPKHHIKKWWIWGYWISPLSYAQKAASVNEFTATRWMKPLGDSTVGLSFLEMHAIPTDHNWYWIGVGVLIAFAFLFNNMVTLALTYLNPTSLISAAYFWYFITALKKSQTVIPLEVSTDDAPNGGKDKEVNQNGASPMNGKQKGMILPFEPLSVTFHNVNYYVDMPKAMRAKGVPEAKLQLLSNVSGVFSPGVLTALVGSSGAGKTTLMDVLAGRKTGGYIEGDIRISGYQKVQHTFARVSGYVEQNDIHSPQVTVEESLRFSSSLRLPKEISKETRQEFVDEVMRLVELDSIRHALVGLPGRTGLSTEQRKRLTIGVELVANPSIIFMDEPTSGLDARAAAIVMRTVRNTVDTGRTVVCTIHQPSIDIFEAFDELLLMKRGGQVIYGGKLGVLSCTMIDYFQGIDGIPPIPDGYNPATWMLEVTTPVIEEKFGHDFANIYRNSDQFRGVEAQIKKMSVPPPGSEPLKFDTTFAQNLQSQFWLCLQKQHLVYWRSPQYNAVRILFTIVCALILGSMFWDDGTKRDSIINLSMLLGALHSTCMFLGVSNASTVQPVVSIERTVFYREKAAGMYSPLAYAAAQAFVEVPYILVQTLLYGIITYFMMGFEITARKFFLYLVFMFLTFTYFTFFGMMIVGLTATQHLAAVISSAFYSLWSFYAGFLVPKHYIPGWWIWFYYICPVSWTLKGMISSQLADVNSILKENGASVKEFIDVNYGMKPEMVGISAAVLIGFVLLFAGGFMASIRFLNFQTR